MQDRDFSGPLLFSISGAVFYFTTRICYRSNKIKHDLKKTKFPEFNNDEVPNASELQDIEDGSNEIMDVQSTAPNSTIATSSVSSASCTSSIECIPISSTDEPQEHRFLRKRMIRPNYAESESSSEYEV